MRLRRRTRAGEGYLRAFPVCALTCPHLGGPGLARFAEQAVLFGAEDQGTVMATLPRAWCPSMWATAVAMWSKG